MFIDKDSPPVNQYSFTVEDDLNVLEPNCTTYEDDREGEPQTAIFCKLVAVRDVQLLQSPYSATLEVNDTTLIPGRGETLVKVPIKIFFDNYHEFPKPLALTMPPTDIKRPLILYPFHEVTIFRTAAPLARVTQPKKANLHVGIGTFLLLRDSSDGAFNVTETEGIVFVHNVTKLRDASEIRITVQWLNNKIKQTDEIIVKITNEPNHTCNEKGPSIRDWTFCSYYKNKKDCNKSCGLSTGGLPGVQRRKIINNPERCMWRGDQNPGNVTTNLYSTCTPDIESCPDGICDSLEELHYLICPQDCAENIGFPMHMNKKTGRGFDVGAGVCSCERSGDCLCEYPDKKKSKGKITTTTTTTLKSNVNTTTAVSTSNTTEDVTVPIVLQSNVGHHVGGELSKCGTKCVLVITGSAIILVLIIGGMLFCFRAYRRHKNVREKFSNETTDLSVPLSDYIDRNAAPENLHFNFNLTTAATRGNGLEVDSKWEFPRSRLSIEQTLGEGEFGRVLRAKAFNIGNQTGHRTVAVKTLKDDAGERELADLLSEYQLLKEVSHPNIIKLLGASTLPGGPVYLIIEFAEHGSLRNYLRRSRHLNTEIHITTNRLENVNLEPDHYDEPKVCEMTPKEILSFAWQIANGMSYLSDIKLVHRDLAARNVLLAAGNICKISDFGLTRDIYEDDAYFKRSKGRVPVKWMAPESLSDHVYTNKSDVWSYGILIWELVTLGASPYPGIVVQSLFHLLKTGYRMERPENCSVVLYKVMRSCWNLDPEKRPTFSDLAMKFEKMLGDEVEYLDLTSNSFNNRGYFCDNLEDVEVDVEDDVSIKNNGTDVTTKKCGTEALNYLNKTIDYEKCGDSVKIDSNNPEPCTEALLPTAQNEMQNSIGYETPIKVQNRIENLPTPGNEFPQYGYTDMTACQSK
ncbi:hypothetical protein FQA39_LY09126 [Lamprigera yunnana]|nr:hypothetical protein FQA39_LY09126 [Lamprigera yunnana]